MDEGSESGRDDTQAGKQACAWSCRYCVSQNSHIEDKIVKELDGLGLLATKERPRPRELQYEDLSKLTYLNLVIKASPALHCAPHLDPAGCLGCSNALLAYTCVTGQSDILALKPWISVILACLPKSVIL